MRKVGFIVLLYGLNIIAGDKYICTIDKCFNSGKEGQGTFAHVNDKFTVDKKTGIMEGSLSYNSFRKPFVIDSGSSENSFKAVTTMTISQGAGKGTTMHALNIEEYVDGNEKPFQYMWNSTVYFGRCK